MAASATFALKAGEWFRRGRLLIVSPDSLGTACPLSGRNSTYLLVQILEAGSVIDRGLAAGEPSKHIARDYALNPSGLHRHRVNCIGLASSTHVVKETARSTA